MRPSLIFSDLIDRGGGGGRFARFVIVCVGIAIFCCATADGAWAQLGKVEPEAASGIDNKDLVVARSHMVVAANPYASKAGLKILRAGGSAVDAVIATQLVLNLVEPQSSGIGGGAFLVRFGAQSGKITTYDGRERAPMSARPDRFMVDGRPMKFQRAVNSGLSVGVPGLVAMMAQAHERHGRLPWRDLFAPAIELAENGFRVSARLHALLAWAGPGRFSPGARAYFYSKGGAPRPIGYVLRNLAFAKTLRLIAAGGPTAFYDGEVAQAIVSAVAGASTIAGDLKLSDLGDYRAVERPGLCVSYRGKRVCGMGPPSSGAFTVGQALALLEGFDLGASGGSGPGARALHLISQAEALAFADRNRYLADPDFVTVPVGLLDPNYIKMRRGLIDVDRAMGRAKAGVPLDVKGELRGVDGTVERGGTSHISVVDRYGNAVSMTSSIEGAFGSGLWAAGFLLNNELTDFSFRSVDGSGRAVANRVEGGKRPRSSMAPTIVLDEGNKVFAVLGSPGGSRIILYVLKSVVALVDWNMDAQGAAALPNFGSRNRGFEIESGYGAVWKGLALKRFGHLIKTSTMTSGLHIIVARDGKLFGGADPRREGVALGE